MAGMTEPPTQPGPGLAGEPGLPRVYDPGAVENGIYERWLAADVFAPDGAGNRNRPGSQPFVVIQPPPNVTGRSTLAMPSPSTSRTCWSATPG